MKNQTSTSELSPCMLRSCNQCGMQVDLTKNIRCPRCNKHMLEDLKCDGNCKKCKE